MQEPYRDVVTRFLREDERHIPSKEKSLPLVIEPVLGKSTVDDLQAFLSSHSSQILTDMANYGAVLLRGFDVKTTKEFEQTILTINGMNGISQFFMSEPGRTHVDGLDYVFHTNSKYKTGGTLHLGGFHNENYYSPDVPSYISFCCFSPGKLGGETGLINMSRVYDKLDAALKEKLEKKTFFVAAWPLSVIANRYQIDVASAKKVCGEFGLSINKDNFIVMHKPSVIKHPVNGKKIIQANLCAELATLNEEVLNHFIPDYRGIRWLFHKTAWTVLGYRRLRTLSVMLPELFRHPVRYFKMRKLIKQRMKQYSNNNLPRINSVFKPEDVKTLAGLMRDSYASFLWKKGDILLIDNLQVAHAGMPGKTSKKSPRKIRAMLCNPFKIAYSDEAPGLQPKEQLLPETLGEIIHKMSLKKSNINDSTGFHK